MDSPLDLAGRLMEGTRQRGAAVGPAFASTARVQYGTEHGDTCARVAIDATEDGCRAEGVETRLDVRLRPEDEVRVRCVQRQATAGLPNVVGGVVGDMADETVRGIVATNEKAVRVVRHRRRYGLAVLVGPEAAVLI